jgi:CheY-like chemotaxis protein
MNTVDIKRAAFGRKRPKSGTQKRLKSARFTNSIKLDGSEIDEMFQKHCECPGILIVDDQYINRFIIQQYAIKYKIKCDEAEDGEEAVNKVREAGKQTWCKGYSLILMDLNMPVMGGIEATREIIDLKMRLITSPLLSIIAVTAFVNETQKEKCLSAGMSDFIAKPFAISDFVRLISR